MSPESISTHAASIAEHPDILAMNDRYERMAETPTAQVTDALTVLTGLFVALSPWIVGFTDQAALARNNLVIGLAVAFLGAGFAMAYERTHRLIWVCPLLGAWTIVSVWTVSGAEATTATVTSNVIGGAVVLVLGLSSIGLMFTERRSAG